MILITAHGFFSNFKYFVIYDLMKFQIKRIKINILSVKFNNIQIKLNKTLIKLNIKTVKLIFNIFHAIKYDHIYENFKYNIGRDDLLIFIK